MDLRRLDDRVVPRAAAWARVVRDAPGLGLLAAASVLLAGTGTGVAVGLSGSQPLRDRPPAESVELGAPVGVDADTHLAAAHARAVRLARETPEARHLALVSLQDELTVDEATRLVAESPLVLRRVYVRAPVQGLPELFAVELEQDPERTLTAFVTATARRKAEEQRELLALAAAGTASTSPDARTSHEAAARTAGQEAAAYASGCACVLALVLDGPAARLADLGSLPAVRGVEVAPRGSRLAATQVTPLPPEVTGPVPAAAADR